MKPETPQTSPRLRIPPLAWPLAAAIAALLWIAFRQPILRMVGIWKQPESYYSHGWLVPLVAIYLLWQRSGEFTVEPRPSKLGFWLLVAGLLMLLVSGWLIVFFTAGFALILVLWGMAGFMFGPAMLRKTLFPAFVLTFMVPPPEQMIANASLSMKMLATKLAMLLIQLFGIATVNDGQTIYLGNSFVTVGNACSGMNSLISLIFLGILFAYFSKLSIWRRIALAASSIPIAIVSNVARIFTLSMAAYFGGTAGVHRFHDASGYLIFVVAFFLLYGTLMLLQWGQRPAIKPADRKP